MKRLLILVAVALAACGATSKPPLSTPAKAAAPTGVPDVVGYVVSTADGDTYHVKVGNGDIWTVRALGIDTPEIAHKSLHITAECGGQHAADIAHLLLVGKQVVLREDPAAGDKDHYGRYLRYVLLGGHTFQARLVRAGLAKVYRYHGQKDILALKWEPLQTHAAQHAIGTWGSCPAAIHQAYDHTHAWQTGPA